MEIPLVSPIHSAMKVERLIGIPIGTRRGTGGSFCGECIDFPCQLLTDYSNDTEHGDNPPGTRIEACKMIKCLLEKK